MSQTAKCGLPAEARQAIVKRSRAEARAPVRWGGSPEGTKATRSRPSPSRAVSAARRCPRWMGSKVPPRRPILTRVPPAAATGSESSRQQPALQRREALSADRGDGHHVEAVPLRFGPEVRERVVRPGEVALGGGHQLRPLQHRGVPAADLLAGEPQVLGGIAAARPGGVHHVERAPGSARRAGGNGSPSPAPSWAPSMMPGMSAATKVLSSTSTTPRTGVRVVKG